MSLLCQTSYSNDVGNNAGNKLRKIWYKSFTFDVEDRKSTDISVHFIKA